MGPRSYVPFDVFAMRTDVPVSTLVRDGAYGWTCGQCPLDRKGDVFAPNDLLAQVRFVGDMIEGVLNRGGFDAASIGKMIVYNVEGKAGEGERAVQQLSRRFAHQPVIVSIPVPHFYYDGMMVEIDIFAGHPVHSKKPTYDQGIDLQIAESGDYVWASVKSRIDSGAGLADRLATISGALDRRGLTAARLLSDHWFLSDQACNSPGAKRAVSDCDLITHPAALVRIGTRDRGTVIGDLTFIRKPVEVIGKANTASGLNVRLRRGGSSLWINGTNSNPRRDLIEQTRNIMTGLEQSLVSQGMSFANVVKLTAHYTGGASAEELHGNMAVRHGFYGTPGPASTGLPVLALLDPDCKIAIDILAIA